MDQMVFRAEAVDEFGMPVIASGFPGEQAVITLNLPEEVRQVMRVFPRGQKGLRALKNNDLRIENVGDL